MQVTLAGSLSYCQCYPLCNWETGVGFLLQNWLQSAWAGAFFALLQLLSRLGSVQLPVHHGVSNAISKKGGSAVVSWEEVLVWKETMSNWYWESMNCSHSFGWGLLAAHFNTENLISTIYTLSSHSFPPPFQTNNSCCYQDQSIQRSMSFRKLCSWIKYNGAPTMAFLATWHIQVSFLVSDIRKRWEYNILELSTLHQLWLKFYSLSKMKKNRLRMGCAHYPLVTRELRKSQACSNWPTCVALSQAKSSSEDFAMKGL